VNHTAFCRVFVYVVAGTLGVLAAIGLQDR
jgi:hypothetical protein